MFIFAEKANYPITWMCQKLGVPRSSYYRWTKACPSATQLRHEALTVEVERVWEASNRILGHRLVHAKLAQANIHVGVGTVAKIMCRQGWQAKRMKAFKRTTIRDHDATPCKDLIGRDFTADTPGSRLVGDITYLKTAQGWMYLATVIDLYSRMVIGWAMGDNMRTPLIIDALEMATKRGMVCTNAIFHSDHGSQYTSREFARWCQGNRIRRSMGATGHCWDNSVAESFFSTFKNEFYHHHRFETRQAARRESIHYIEAFYNRWRPHTSNNGLSPATKHHNYHSVTTTTTEVA